jgi:RNA ligase (TIGR02306 family)
MERKLASIQKIEALLPIEGADKIKLARVLGWQVVVKAEEFSVGDRCIFFEIDSVLPVASWNDHLRKGSDKPLRVRTIRLRGQISQGIALPVNSVTQFYAGLAAVEMVQPLEIGTDVTAEIGVLKYEPPVPASMDAKGNFPSFLKKTDETRLQSEPGLLDELIRIGEAFGTLKMDGSSLTAYLKDDQFGICSRNMELKDTVGNKYWSIAHKLALEEKMRDWSRIYGFGNFAVQGELCGPGIQANRIGLKENDLFLFNVWSIDEHHHRSFETVREFSKLSGIKHVPVVFEGKFTFNTLEELLQFSDEQVYPSGHPAEGVVWRSIDESPSKILHGDRLSFKVISNKFLLKTGE